MADRGEGPGGSAPPPSYFLDQTEVQRAPPKNRASSLSQGLDDGGPLIWKSGSATASNHFSTICDPTCMCHVLGKISDFLKQLCFHEFQSACIQFQPLLFLQRKERKERNVLQAYWQQMFLRTYINIFSVLQEL